MNRVVTSVADQQTALGPHYDVSFIRIDLVRFHAWMITKEVARR